MDDNNAQLDDLDMEEQALRDEALKASPPRPDDATIEDDSTAGTREPDQQERRPEKPANTTTPDPKTKPATPKATKPEAKPATEPAKDPTTTDDEPEDDAKLTPYKREQARQARAWQKIEARKAEIQAKEEALARRQAEIEAATKATKTPAPTTPTAPADKITVEDYEAVAADYEREGNHPLAEKARAKAMALRAEAKAAEAATKTATPAIDVEAEKAKWQRNLVELGKEHPELQQEDSPLRQRVSALLKQHLYFHQSGEGIRYAVEAARLQLQAEQADTLQARVTELEAEIQRLTELTAIPPGTAPARTEAKPFDQMNLEEQEAYLRREAQGQAAA